MQSALQDDPLEEKTLYIYIFIYIIFSYGVQFEGVWSDTNFTSMAQMKQRAHITTAQFTVYQSDDNFYVQCDSLKLHNYGSIPWGF